LAEVNGNEERIASPTQSDEKTTQLVFTYNKENAGRHFRYKQIY